MNKTLTVIRIVFLLFCITGSMLVAYLFGGDTTPRWVIIGVGVGLGVLTILTDIYLKGFSLRGLTALSFGLAIGLLIATLISVSPLFDPLVQEEDSAGTVYLVRLALFIVCTYLGAVLALRGRDEFNLVIPYVRFVPHEVNVPLMVVDTSALIDGRIAALAESRWLAQALIIPRFVLDELQAIADSSDPARQRKGRQGLETLSQLRELPYLDLRIHESEVEKGAEVDAKLIFLAQSLKAQLLTTDFNLAKLAEFHGVRWLNLNSLAKALNPDTSVGEQVRVELVKPGKERGQALGFLPDGAMVVINDAQDRIGEIVDAEVTSVLPSAGGKMFFARLKE